MCLKAAPAQELLMVQCIEQEQEVLGVRASHPTEEGNSTALPSRRWGLMGGSGSGALTGDKAPGLPRSL